MINFDFREVCGTSVDFGSGVILEIRQGPIDEPPELVLAEDRGLNEGECCESIEGVVREIFVRRHPGQAVPQTLRRTDQRRKLGVVNFEFLKDTDGVVAVIDPIALRQALSSAPMGITDEDQMERVRKAIETHAFWRDYRSSDQVSVVFKKKGEK